MIHLTRTAGALALAAALMSCGAVAGDSPDNPGNAGTSFWQRLAPAPVSRPLTSEEMIIADGSNPQVDQVVRKLSAELTVLPEGISRKYPDMIPQLSEYAQKAKELRSRAQTPDPLALAALRSAYSGKYSKQHYLDIFQFGVEASLRILSADVPDTADTVSTVLKLCFIISDLFPGDIKPGQKELMYSAFAMLSRRIFDLNSSNTMLSSAEDFLAQADAEGGGDDSRDGAEDHGYGMFRAINNYFLENHRTAVSIFENSPEFYDTSSEWYLYNKLNLYLAYLALDPARAEDFLQKFLASPVDEKNRSSWAWRLLEALDSRDPSDLIRHAADDAASERELAERLCEAYYYIGMQYYRRGARNTARIYFILSRAQNVVEFLEHEFSSLALHFYYGRKEGAVSTTTWTD